MPSDGRPCRSTTPSSWSSTSFLPPGPRRIVLLALPESLQALPPQGLCSCCSSSPPSSLSPSTDSGLCSNVTRSVTRSPITPCRGPAPPPPNTLLFGPCLSFSVRLSVPRRQGFLSLYSLLPLQCLEKWLAHSRCSKKIC